MIIRRNFINSVLAILVIGLAASCNMPKPEKKKSLREKHNYIVLLDLSDRLVVQDQQSERDRQIIKAIYGLFEEKVKKELYVKSRDEFKVVIAPQRGSRLDSDTYEDRLYVNMDNIQNVYRRSKEEERRQKVFNNIDSLYLQASFSKNPKAYYGADIWKYFHEDLTVDYARDTLTKNYLFILTDGYPIVGKDPNKLKEIKAEYPGLHIVLIEAAPRDKDMEWDRVMDTWKVWFDQIGIEKYTLIKRGAISKEIEQVKAVVASDA